MFDSLGSVTHLRPAEIASHFVWSVLGTPKEPSDVAYHFPLIPRTLPPYRVGLDVLVEQFVRVELRTVSGQEVNSELSVPSYPLYRFLRNMNGVPVDDQKDPARVLPDKTFQEIEKQRRRKSSLEDSEGQCATIGNRRNHVAAKSFPRSGNNRGMSASAVGRASLMIRTYPRFVAPKDRRFFSTSQSANCRVFPFQPAPNRRRILFVGVTHRFLRGKSPARQITADCPNRQPDTEALLNQIPDCLARPKHKGQFELVGTTVGNQPHNSRRLVRLQMQDTWSATRLGAQSRQSFASLALVPTVDRLPGNAEYAGRFGLRHTRSNYTDDSHTQAFLGLGRQTTHIQDWHIQNYTRWKRICQTFLLVTRNSIDVSE